MSTPSLDGHTRMLRVLHGEVPDRVPVFEEVILPRTLAHVLGHPVEGWTRVLPPEELVEFTIRAGLDALVVSLGCGLGGGIRAFAEQETVRAAHTQHYVGGTIKTWQDLSRIQPFDREALQSRLEAYVLAVRGSGLGLCAWISSPLTSAYTSMGIEDFWLTLHDDPAFIAHLMDLQMLRSRQALEIIVRYPEVTWVTFGDDISHAHGMMARPEYLWKEWVPRLRWVIAPAKGIKPVMLHDCGGMLWEHVMAMDLAIGFDAHQPLAPTNNLDAIKRDYGDKVCLMGTLPLDFLIAATPETVREETKRHLRTFGPGGRYVCGSSHSINDLVPPENFLAMVETVREYGWYRPDGTLARV